MARKLAEPSKALADADALARSEAFRLHEEARVKFQQQEATGFMRSNGLRSAEDCVALARNTLRSIGSTVDPLANWRRVLANPNAGLLAHEMAREAIAKLEQRGEDREPGSDDEPVHV